MSTEADPTVLEAVVKARRIARTAKLVDVARGKKPWWSWIFPIVLLIVFGYFLRRTPMGDVGWSIAAALGLLGWHIGQTERRIEAVLQLLLDEKELAESQKLQPA